MPTCMHSVSSPMSDPPSNVYQGELSASSHWQGIALWDPSPLKQFYDKVSIGDVGYLHASEGVFIRLFNVLLPWDDPWKYKLGIPESYEPLDHGPFSNTFKRQFDRIEHYSRSVSAGSNNMQTVRLDE